MTRWIAIVTVVGALVACGPKSHPAAPTEPPPAAETDPAAASSSGEAHQPATSFDLDGNRLVVPPINFESGDATLAADADAGLWLAKDYLDAKDYITTMRIEVHTSSDTPDGQALTEARALAVGHWLIAHGIACERLVAVGFGANKPVADDSTPDGKAANRRVEFQNAALRGHPIGGMPLDGGGNVAGDLCAN